MKPQKQLDVPVEEPNGKAKPSAGVGRPLVSLESAIFKDVRVQLQAKLGETTLTVEDLLALKAGSVVKLGLKLNELIELRLNDNLVARGEIVAVDDNFGIRIVEIAQP